MGAAVTVAKIATGEEENTDPTAFTPMTVKSMLIPRDEQSNFYSEIEFLYG